MTQRKGLWCLKIRLRHSIAEECGQLALRGVLDIESAPPLSHIVEGFSPDKWLEQLLNRGDTPAPEHANSSSRGARAWTFRFV